MSDKNVTFEYIATRKNVMERFVKKGDTEVESTETYIKYGSQYQDIESSPRDRDCIAWRA